MGSIYPSYSSPITHHPSSMNTLIFITATRISLSANMISPPWLCPHYYSIIHAGEHSDVRPICLTSYSQPSAAHHEYPLSLQPAATHNDNLSS
jgi:hypothetical protein